MRVTLAVLFGFVAVVIASCCGVAPGPVASPKLPEAGKVPPPAQASNWLDGRLQAWTKGDMQVRVKGYSIGHVGLVRFGESGYSTDDYMVITVEVSNQSPAQKLDFKPWSESVSTPVQIHDDLGNVYREIDFGFTSVYGRSGRSTVYCEKPVIDILVFERPVAAAKTIYLTLPLDESVSKEPIRFSLAAPRLAEQTTASPVAKREETKGKPNAKAEGRAIPPADPQELREKAAAGKLTLASELLRDPEKVERGRTKLREIVRDYSGTKAAAEAEKLLNNP